MSDNKQVLEQTISDECRWCAEGEPEWSDYARCWIHRRSTVDKRCLRKTLSPVGNEMKMPDDLREEYEEIKTCALRDNAEHYKDRCINLIERIAASEAREKELRQLYDLRMTEIKNLEAGRAEWQRLANEAIADVTSLRAEVERLKLFHGYAEDGKAILAAALQHAQDQHDLKKLRAQLAEMQSKLAQQQQIVLNKGTAILDLESNLADATKPVTDEEWDNHGHAVSETINDSWSDFYKRVANAVLSARAAKGGE